MNCECFYVIKGNTLETAREFVDELNRVADRQQEEVYPVYICQAKKTFKATPDYDNCGTIFTVKKDTWLVFACGKDYCMNRIRPNGGRRGFPNKFIHKDFYEKFYDYIVDVEPIKYGEEEL